jgi:hypothetical protein
LGLLEGAEGERGGGVYMGRGYGCRQEFILKMPGNVFCTDGKSHLGEVHHSHDKFCQMGGCKGGRSNYWGEDMDLSKHTNAIITFAANGAAVCEASFLNRKTFHVTVYINLTVLAIFVIWILTWTLKKSDVYD